MFLTPTTGPLPPHMCSVSSFPPPLDLLSSSSLWTRILFPGLYSHLPAYTHIKAKSQAAWERRCRLWLSKPGLHTFSLFMNQLTDTFPDSCEYSGNVCGYPSISAGYGGTHLQSHLMGKLHCGECLNQNVRDQPKQHSETLSQIWVKNQDCPGLSQSWGWISMLFISKPRLEDSAPGPSKREGFCESKYIQF